MVRPVLGRLNPTTNESSTVIDFRYHIVSLISVFLALAVGIALGAGPLKEAIGDSLTGQVEQLRQEKDDLRSALSRSEEDLTNTESFVDQSAAQILPGLLTDKRVAVVTLGEISEETTAGVDARLLQAGATVTGHVGVTNTWTAATQRSYRSAFVATLGSYLSAKPAGDATTEDQLAAALAQGLTETATDDPNGLSEAARTLLQLLATGDDPLITIEQDVNVPADAIVIVVPTAASDNGQTAPTEEVLTAQMALVKQSGSLAAAVVAGGVRVEGDLISTLIASGEPAVTTVSNINTVTAQVSVPLALAVQLSGQVGHYGAGEGETVMPPVIEPAAAAPEEGQ